jgi:UDP-glucose 4-epimerase
MKILVTGGAGFIGSHVVDKFIEAGHMVSVVDNLSTGHPSNINPDCRFYNVDVLSPELGRVFRSERPEAVCHHAAQIDIRRSLFDPEYDTEVNVVGTVNVLEGCRENGIKTFIFASSGGSIYGEPDSLPADETYPSRPTAPYGAAKAAGEQYVELFGRMTGLRYVNLRYGNVYGPRQDPMGEAGVVAIFMNRLLSGTQATIFGEGNQVRDYVFVSDVAQANLRALGSSSSGTFNIATGVGTSVNALYEMIRAETASDMMPRYQPARLGEVGRIILDCRLAESGLGWTAATKLRDGLKTTAASYALPAGLARAER